MIEVMQGALGSGKSAVCTARAIAHLQEGGVVAANFALTDGFADVIAKRNPLCRWKDDLRYEKSSSIYNRFYHVQSLDAVKQIDPRALAVGKRKSTPDSYSEGHGLLILDECHMIFNSRKWEKNMDWIQFFAMSRKLGWDVILVAHTIEMIDSQIRPLCEYESRFRNLRKIKIPFTPFPLSPYPVFLVVQRYAGLGAGASVISGRGLYPLPLWAARLYDSLLVFDSGQWGVNSNPSLCGPPPAPPCGDGGASRREVLSSCDCLWTRADAYFDQP